MDNDGKETPFVSGMSVYEDSTEWNNEKDGRYFVCWSDKNGVMRGAFLEEKAPTFEKKINNNVKGGTFMIVA